MATLKCAHPTCNCTVPADSPYGKFCSDICKDAKGMTQLHCGCPHPQCRAA